MSLRWAAPIPPDEECARTAACRTRETICAARASVHRSTSSQSHACARIEHGDDDVVRNEIHICRLILHGSHPTYIQMFTALSERTPRMISSMVASMTRAFGTLSLVLLLELVFLYFDCSIVCEKAGYNTHASYRKLCHVLCS